MNSTPERIIFKKNEVPSNAFKHNFIFDTNVWLHIHGFDSSDPQNPRTEAYSYFYKAALDHGKQIYLTQAIISEYVGTSLAFQGRVSGWQRKNGKIHQHPDYNEWMDGISSEASYIRDDSVPLNDDFSSIDIYSLCKSCCTRPIDFTDAQIVEACNRANLTLVTDDADFKKEPIRIISFNKKIKI